MPLYYYRPWSYTEFHTEVFCSFTRGVVALISVEIVALESTHPRPCVFSLHGELFAFDRIADSWPHSRNWNQAFVELLRCDPLSTALQKYLDSICTFPCLLWDYPSHVPISGEERNGRGGGWGQTEESDLMETVWKSGGNRAQKAWLEWTWTYKQTHTHTRL